MKYPHTAVIRNPTTVTDPVYGDEVEGWDEEGVEEDAFFQPRVGSEETMAEDVQIGDGVIYFHPGSAVTGRSRVEVLGKTYKVLGPPEVWSTGSPLDNVRAIVRHIEG